MCRQDKLNATASSLEERRLDQLQAHEICLEGKIYSIKDFDHPGGESIQVFGGQDATVLYRMIHANHSKLYHTFKLPCVGVVTDYQSEYTFDSDFAKELKSEVQKAVPQHQQYGTFGFFSRAIFYILLTASLTYYWTFIQPTYIVATLLGISLALIGLNVQHDANHGAASSTQWINEVLGYGADALGGSKWHWISHHWTHHAYTNHNELDPDVTAAEPFLIFTNYALNDPHRQWYHRFQVLLFLPAMAAYWLSKVTRWADTQINAQTFSGCLRLLHLVILFVPPVVQYGWEWKALYQTLTIGASGSLVLGVLFSLSHNFEGSVRRAPRDTTSETTAVCWYKTQVETSCTYGGFVSGCLTGGLNYQIEHHLFPRMSSAHYPTIAPIVRKVCAKHKVRYTYFPYLWDNLASLVRSLHVTGNGPNKPKTL